jgi:TonB family protein
LKLSLLVLPLVIPIAMTLPAAAASAAPTVRTPPKAKLISTPPYPPEARKKGVEGNVVLAGEITADGKVAGMKVIASSSPLLERAALAYVSRWAYASPAKENGNPVAIRLNTVAHFVKDRTRPKDPVSLSSPIAGNVALYPIPAHGAANPAFEGFPIEADDRGIAGVLDLDLPASFSPKAYTVDVTDVGPGGKVTLLLEKSVKAGSRNSTVSLPFSHSTEAARRERGLHTVRITVDGANAGGAQYQIGGRNP